MSPPIPPTQDQGFQPPIDKKEAKRLRREQEAVRKANRNWFARHRILTAIGAVAIIAIIANLAGGGGKGASEAQPASAQTTAAASETTPAATETSAAAVAEETTAAPAEETTAAAEPAAATIGNGDHFVGTDMMPGQYRAEVEDSFIPLCTVSQSKGDEVIDVRNANEGSVIFTVKDSPGTVVSFSGCANIALAAESVRANPSPITNGDWLVGPELAPGQYKGVVDTDSALKLGTAYQSSASGDVMDIRNANEGNVLFTVAESEGSVVSFSGFKSIEFVG